MLNHMNSLEQELRSSARSANQLPSPALRRRTLSKLHDQPTYAKATARAPRPLALAMLGLFVVGLSMVGYVKQEWVADSTSVAKSPQIPDQASSLPPLPKFTVPRVQAAIAGPLKHELDLMAREAERTIEHVKHQLARLPRLESFAPMHHSDTDELDAR